MGTKKIVSLAAFVALVGIGSQAIAAPTAGGRTESAKITRIFSQANGTTLVSLDNNRLTNGNVCSPQSRYSIAPDAGNSKGGLAIILTARALESNVQFDVTTCDDVGAVSPAIFNVILVQ